MIQRQIDDFCWNNMDGQKEGSLSDHDKYQALVNWAVLARGKNPNVFDALTEWILDDSEWTQDKLAENEEILMQGVLGRFKEQNRQLRACLNELEPSNVVNKAVYKMLDRFDKELLGCCENPQLRKVVSRVFTDFSLMKDHNIREQFAGNKTGPTGTDSVELFGYMNTLKECDAGVQWTLFMPEDVERKQNGFKVENFVYRQLPAMRFVGIEGAEYDDVPLRMSKMKILDSLSEYNSGFDYDIFLMHFYGIGVDVGEWHGVFGRFMKPDTPVPEGFVSIDFLPTDSDLVGPPYISEFAFATFTGDLEAMHKREGFDGDAMYDITRNIILGQGACIPYPKKYWTAEVFFNGCDKPSTGYLFSARP